MATTPTSPSGLLYAALIRRVNAAVPALAGKVWTLQAPAKATAPFLVLKPISGDESQATSGPTQLHRKTVQLMVKGPEAEGLEGVMATARAVEQLLIGAHFSDLVSPTRRVHVDSALPAGDGFEDYDEQSREYVAFLRAEILYRIETVTP